ncbi:NADH-ubiquinone oxidoreductase 12 kDa subunit, mitochondrial [Lachnellula occidentalis]|uniref:NADH-ubiquinone oxidoreductase 12 kDa subunit, mitochondrial n=1 Tax=Lachnellula occidentalis TaxID=215460 RepID=A0A8H8S4E5_9HELO|nr:NADH-ubiquinone oxidoreductase 12 kDa subunit, mitochondrial [Lachnellula occidentalis]
MAPTPESAAFLAKKPTVPPTFDGVDYDDTARLKQAQDAIIREQWVRSMMARLVREEMGKCYYREGVNHLEKCGALRGKNARESQVQLELELSIDGNGRDICNITRLVANSYCPPERYFELLKESKIRGYLFEQGNRISKPQ